MTRLQQKATDCTTTASLMYGDLLAGFDWATFLQFLLEALKLVACLAPYLGPLIRRRVTRLVNERYGDFSQERRAALVEVALDLASSVTQDDVAAMRVGI